MKRPLDAKALKSAYGPVTPSFYRKTEDVLNRLQQREEIKVQKKISTALVVALIIVGLVGIALAASIQVFSLFSQRQDNPELQAVNQAATEGEQGGGLQIAEGIRFTVPQSYFDETQLYFAYRIDGATAPDYDYLPDDQMLSKMTKLEPNLVPLQTEESFAEISKRLASSGKAGWIAEVISLSDNIDTVAGENLNIIANDEMTQDGVLMGYRKFEVTPDIAQAYPTELALEQRVHKSTIAYYYEGSDISTATIYQYQSEPESQTIQFVAPRNQSDVHTFDFSKTFEAYAVTGVAKISPINIQVEIAISGSEEWNQAMRNLNSMEDKMDIDIVWEYELRVNGTPVKMLDYAAYEGGLLMTFERPQGIMILELVPIYFTAGPNEAEIIEINTAG